MAERKRSKIDGFVGVDLGVDLVKKLDAKVKEVKATTGSGNRSALIRQAVIQFLK